jgi:hypothetical protein
VTGCGSLGTSNYPVDGFDTVLGILLDEIAAPDSHVGFDPVG